MSSVSLQPGWFPWIFDILLFRKGRGKSSGTYKNSIDRYVERYGYAVLPQIDHCFHCGNPEIDASHHCDECGSTPDDQLWSFRESQN